MANIGFADLVLKNFETFFILLFLILLLKVGSLAFFKI